MARSSSPARTPKAAVPGSSAAPAPAQSRWARKRSEHRTDKLETLRFKAKQRDLRLKARSARWASRRQWLGKVAQGSLVVAPIVAPMFVAWTGQSGFAMRVLGWSFVGSIVYAAAYELTTVFCAWMRRQVRAEGDSALKYRLATWMFAIGSAVQQWWHYSNNWDPTPRSVAYSTMTMIGLAVWELYDGMINLRTLRRKDRAAKARPRFGLARWVRFPRHTFSAWSLAVRDGHTTIASAWEAAEADLAARPPRTPREGWFGRRTPAAGPAPTPAVEVQQIRTPDPVDPGPAPTPEIRTPDPRPAITAGPRVQTPTLQGPDPVDPGPTPAADPAGPEIQTRPTPTPQTLRTPTPRVQIRVPDPVGSEQTPAAGSAEGEAFEPTGDEVGVIQGMLTAGVRLNRANVAAAVRGAGLPIKTERAARLAQWGRENGEGLRSVS